MKFISPNSVQNMISSYMVVIMIDISVRVKTGDWVNVQTKMYLRSEYYSLYMLEIRKYFFSDGLG